MKRITTRLADSPWHWVIKFLPGVLLIFNLQTKAQDTTFIRNWYSMTASELIFSGGQVKSGGTTLSNIVRFSAFLNLQEQRHYNFSNSFGFFTGIGIRNVGFINKVPVNNDGGATVKQRSYSLGIPFALKFGNMRKGNYLAVGIEPEWMFAYKEKILFNDQKSKNSAWFSGNVNPINPSVFLDLRSHGGSYIRFKYYLLDFLKDKDMDFIAPNYLSNNSIYYHPESSKLFYVAIGTSFRDRKHKKHHATLKEV